jgi:hypothetical protein
VRRPLRRLVPAAGACCALAAVAWALGVDGPHTVALGLAGATTVVAAGAFPRSGDPFWPEGPPQDGGRGWHGAALQSRLLERLDAEPDRIPRLLVPRLRDLLTGALAERGVAPGSVAARSLVGPELYDLLSASTWPAGAPGATEVTRRVLARADELRGDRTAPTDGRADA